MQRRVASSGHGERYLGIMLRSSGQPWVSKAAGAYCAEFCRQQEPCRPRWLGAHHAQLYKHRRSIGEKWSDLNIITKEGIKNSSFVET